MPSHNKPTVGKVKKLPVYRPPGSKPKAKPKPAAAREPRSGNVNQNKLLRKLKKGGHY